jgi:hypothetical protein
LPTVGSGVIYAVLVAMWAAYFIPRWLRHHEERSEARSVERFDRAMRVLSSSDATSDKRYVTGPPRPATAPFPAQRSREGQGKTSSVAVRRRRVLAALLLALLLTSALAPLTAMPWWAPLVALSAIVGWLVHCRLQARTRTVVSRTRQAARKRSRSRLMRFDALERLMTVRRELAAERAAEETRWEEAGEAIRREQAAEQAERSAAEGGWTPVPVPLPTYVTKPVAPGRAGTIDLTRPGAWTAAQEAAAKAAQAPTAPPPVGTAPMSVLMDDADEAGEQLDAIIERRAVND